MNSVIIYPNDVGGICVVYPCECGISIEEIARKDVPAGKPYLIVNAEQVPEDHTFFGAWEADFSNQDGIGVGQQAWFAEQAAKEQA